jgi:hypothetical protein
MGWKNDGHKETSDSIKENPYSMMAWKTKAG